MYISIIDFKNCKSSCGPIIHKLSAVLVDNTSVTSVVTVQFYHFITPVDSIFGHWPKEEPVKICPVIIIWHYCRHSLELGHVYHVCNHIILYEFDTVKHARYTLIYAYIYMYALDCIALGGGSSTHDVTAIDK